MAPEKRGIQSFFAPVAKKPKAGEAPTTVTAPVSNAVAKSPAKSPKKPVVPDTGVPSEDGVTTAQRQRAELNKQVAISKQLQKKAWEAAEQAGQQPNLDSLLVETTWRAILEAEFKKAYMQNLKDFLLREWRGVPKVFPAPGNIFRAFNTCPMERVKVVILGQDPYHDTGQAMGLSFSVPRGWKVPSSLSNIFKELGSDLGCTKPTHGDLDKWATQGVLMLNASLTVQAHKANSHSKKGWETFTDAAVKSLAANREGLVWMLWGKNAQEKEKLIDRTKGHLVLKSPHPSGLSAHRGFYGCKHFSQANAFIESKGGTAIDWQIV
tara:strand:- start:833 stop:1801 length:969 start_codon:yes stop_codon:yes gene_type:complete